jgi:2-polyprenyl-6-hydroxyphenyl methylase / 3-demethylubiquinone-9 3-methyltransferase
MNGTVPDAGPTDAASTQVAPTRPDLAGADPAEIDKFDRLAAAWWDPSGPFRTLHDINPARARYIAERARLEGARVLDVGCGGGLLSEALAAEGADVLGIDLAADCVAAAAAHAAQTKLRVTYRRASVDQIADESESGYDVVTCLEMLEHVPDPQRVVFACARAAKPGAHVFFSTINRNAKSFLMSIVAAEYLLGLLPRGTHEYAKLIRPAELARACRSAGLDVVEITGLHLNPLTHECSLGGNVDVNYVAWARKPASR